MAQRYELGRLAGLRLTAGPSAIVGSAVLRVLLSSVAVLALGISLGAAVVGGLVAVLLHWVSEERPDVAGMPSNVATDWDIGANGLTPCMGDASGSLGMRIAIPSKT